MYVVNIGLDPKTLNPESVVASRNRMYGSKLSHYSVIVPSPSKVTVNLSDETTAYGIAGANKAVQLYRMYRKADSLIKAGKCDVITSQDMYYLGVIGYILARMHHLGFEVQVLGIEKLSWLRKRIARFVLQRASIVRALSDRLENRLIEEFGIPKEHIRVVTIFVDVYKLGLDVRTLGANERSLFESHSKAFKEQYGSYMNFLTVSRLVPIKRIELQFQALKEVLKTYPNARLHIVGNGPQETELKALAVNLSIEEYVIFHGYKTGVELGMFYIECDCFLLTSDYEGWGMVIIEAAIAGIPIIMADVGCAGEFIIHEESGLVIPTNSASKLQEAMERLSADSDLRNRLSVGAIEATKRLPNFESVVQMYVENWKVALSKPL